MTDTLQVRCPECGTELRVSETQPDVLCACLHRYTRLSGIIAYERVHGAEERDYFDEMRAERAPSEP